MFEDRIEKLSDFEYGIPVEYRVPFSKLAPHLTSLLHLNSIRTMSSLIQHSFENLKLEQKVAKSHP